MFRRSTKIRDESGQSMTELALVLPLLGLLLFGIIQFGIAFNNYITLTDAVRAGARVAAVSRQATDPVAVTQAQVEASAQGLSLTASDITVTPADPNWAPGTNVTVSASYPYKIDVLGFVFSQGRLSSTTTERIE